MSVRVLRRYEGDDEGDEITRLEAGTAVSAQVPNVVARRAFLFQDSAFRPHLAVNLIIRHHRNCSSHRRAHCRRRSRHRKAHWA